MSDFAILLGGNVSLLHHTKESLSLKHRTGSYLLSPFGIKQPNVIMPNDDDYMLPAVYMDMVDNGTDFPYIKFTEKFVASNTGEQTISITTRGQKNYHPLYDYFDGIRPIINYSEISSNITHERINRFGIKEVCFGEYPQTVLNKNYDIDMCPWTKKRYTVPIIDGDNHRVLKNRYKEYEYIGEKFIVFDNYEYHINNFGQCLSDGRRITPYDSYLVKVEPIVWLVDEEHDIAISKNILFIGSFALLNVMSDERKFIRLYDFFHKYFSLEVLPTAEYLSKVGKKKRSNKDKESKSSKKQKKILSQLDLDSKRVLQDLDRLAKTTTDRKMICEKLEKLKEEILHDQSCLEGDTSPKIRIKK